MRTTVSLCLASNFPINIIWGPENIQIYNDGYRVVCGEAHPGALGESYNVTWASAWPAIGAPFEKARQGETSFLENQRMFLTRNGYLEETFFTFSTSPIRDESGEIGGLFHPVTETTETIVAGRRTRTLRDLTASLGAATDLSSLVSLTVSTLSSFTYDLPFLLFYQRATDGEGYRLVDQYGVSAGTRASPAFLDAGLDEPWPLGAAIRQMQVIEATQISALFDDTPCGPYAELPDRAFVIPLWTSSSAIPSAVLIVGASSRLPMTEAYRGFYELLAAAVTSAIINVRAREDDRQRADALAAIDRAKTQFFTNVSHEFRTPLTLMLGPLEQSLANAERLPEADRERVTIAHRNGLRLLKLVNSLLDFSRIEAERAQVRLVPTDLGTFTAELASNFRSACERAGLELIIENAPLPQPVYVDVDMWEKIILNLISNAFKFTLAGKIHISVGPAADGASVQVCVSDTGIGIAADELPRLFERFHQVAGAQGRSFEGSGIGLALVKELVKLQGADISVTSQPGQGTTFVLTLPFGSPGLPDSTSHAVNAQLSTATRASAFVEEALRWLPDDTRDPHENNSASVADDSAASSLCHGRVILADDNADMRSYVARLLTAEGLTVESVADGEAALIAAQQHTPDLILTDIMMPRLDGFGLLQAVRANPRLATIPVLLLSARAGEEARVEGIEAGADDYLTKPFSARELVSRVKASLERARERRDAVLRESEARLRLAVEAGQIGEWELDVGADSSVRAELHDKIFGHDEPVEHWGFETFISHVLEEDRAIVEAAYRHAAQTGTGWNFQCRILRANDQQLRWIDARSTAQVDADGRAVKLFGLVRDITDQKLSEIRLQELNDTLERRVTEVINERKLAEDQMRQSQKMEAVGQLTGGVAHDFNNLLTVIRSSIDLLLRPNLSEDRRGRYLAAISETVTRASKLTGQLLAFARRQTLQPELLNVNKSVLALVDMIGTLIGSRLQTHTVLPDEDCFIHVDPNQFDTALLNLMVNARDAMSSEGVLSITVSTVEEIPQVRDNDAVRGEYVAISISDNGLGIAAESIDRIFDPFYTTKGVGKGTGLGLSQVFGFVKQSGGEISVHSVVGQGTTFVLYLKKITGQQQNPSPEPKLLVEGHGTRVLVVEDNTDVGTFATETLAELGYQTSWASNAEEALAVLEKTDGGFDVVFSDVMMPGMNGIDLALAIRQRYVGLPVVLTSGYSHVLAEDGTHGFELLQKPYSIDELARALRQACS